MSDDDDDEFSGCYEHGHWEWNEDAESLVFESDFPEVKNGLPLPTPTLIGSIKFKEDLDLLEQDIKDVVCFTAPKAILTPAIIKVLHLPITERLMRALILYCQYFLQISDLMAVRIMEQNFKIRTATSEQLELEFRDNLEDLRLLIAKEYSCVIMGSGEVAKYHHMGTSKKGRSLSKRDSIFFETLLVINVQIVWLALGRKSYNQIELEIHRLFKSDIYNIKHNQDELSEKELFVLFGDCVQCNRMINTFSPLNNEMQCNRNIDYRMIGLGSVKYPKLSYRLRFLERVLIEPEEQFEKWKMTLGIIGLPRARFDTMLKEIKVPISTASSSSSFRQPVGKLLSTPRMSRASTVRKSTLQQKLYEDIYIPETYSGDEYIPDSFPGAMLPAKHCNKEQLRRWMSYVKRSKRNK